MVTALIVFAMVLTSPPPLLTLACTSRQMFYSLFGRYASSVSVGPRPRWMKALFGAVVGANVAVVGVGVLYEPSIPPVPPTEIIKLPNGRRISYREYGAPNGKVVFAFPAIAGSRYDIDAFNYDAKLKPPGPGVVKSTAASPAPTPAAPNPVAAAVTPAPNPAPAPSSLAVSQTAASAAITAAQDRGSLAADAGVRVIALDRAGYGASDPDNKRSIADYPKEVLAVADQLGVNEFGVIGFSTAGVYALACADQLNRIAPQRLKSVSILSADGSRIAPDSKRMFVTFHHRCCYLYVLIRDSFFCCCCFVVLLACRYPTPNHV